MHDNDIFSEVMRMLLEHIEKLVKVPGYLLARCVWTDDQIMDDENCVWLLGLIFWLVVLISVFVLIWWNWEVSVDPAT